MKRLNLLYLLLLTSPLLSQNEILWTDGVNGNIYRSVVDVNTTRTVYAKETPYYMVISEEDQKIYWSDGQRDRIMRADVDGSNRELVVPYVEFIRGLAINEEDGILYYGLEQEIMALDLTTFESSVLVQNIYPQNVYFDQNDNKVCWWQSDRRVRCVDLDGSNLSIFASNIEGDRLQIDFEDRIAIWLRTYSGNEPPYGPWNRHLIKYDIDSGSEEELWFSVFRGLAIDTDNNIVFATDWEILPSIWNFNYLNTSQYGVIEFDDPEHPVVRPSTACFDKTNNRVYWYDEYLAQTVSSKSAYGGIEDRSPSVFSYSFRPYSITLDTLTGYYYWLTINSSASFAETWHEAKLVRTTSEFADVEVVAEFPILDDPIDFALDIWNEQIYILERKSQLITRVNFDGTGLDTLVSSYLVNPSSIYLDTGNGKIYWGNPNSVFINRSNLDGSSVEHFNLPNGLITKVYSFTIHSDNQKAFWTDNVNNKVFGYDIPSGQIDFVIALPHKPYDIKILGDRIYWTDHNVDTNYSFLKSADMNGSNIDTVDILRISGVPSSFVFGDDIQPTSIKTPTVNELKVFPNPVSDIISIEGYTGQLNVLIYNQLGEAVLSTNLTEVNGSINISHLPSGIYFLRTIDKKHRYKTQKVIKN